MRTNLDSDQQRGRLHLFESSLTTLFNHVLHPRMGDMLRITQQELAYLVGLSRQRVNEALSTLQARGLVRLEYGGLKVLDIVALRTRVFD
jgi:CRP/FNR family transcriptional regulator, cyclic AMP receptor protein